MLHLYASTDPEWLGFHRSRNSQRVCFWQPTPGKPRFIEQGKRWYFCPKRSGKIVGYGIYQGYEKLQFKEVWQKFGELTGSQSEEELRQKIAQISGNPQADSEFVGCVDLAEIVYLEMGFDLNEVGLDRLRRATGKVYEHHQLKIEKLLEARVERGEAEHGSRELQETEPPKAPTTNKEAELIELTESAEARQRRGPAPAIRRRRIMHMRREHAYTYAMKVVGAYSTAFKIGWAFDYKRRVKQFNQAAMPELGGLEYKPVYFKYWDTARQAYRMEQQLLAHFANRLHPANREIVQSVDENDLQAAWVSFVKAT